MKRLYLFLGLSILLISSSAQTLDDIGRITIAVQPIENQTIPDEALDILYNKMHQIITNNGFSNYAIDKRFALSAEVGILKKDIINGSPAKVSQQVSITFYVKDIIDKKEFGNTNITTIGVGLNENKAYISAFSQINPRNPNIQKLISTSKELIVQYYRTNITSLLAQVDMLVSQGNYKKAIAILSNVPDVCADCTKQCQQKAIIIYQQWINKEGKRLLQSAKTVWAKQPNAQGASLAVDYLQQINILADCQSQVSDLLEEIKIKIKADEQKAWEFKLQQYADAREKEKREYEFRVQQYNDRLERQKKEAEYEQYRFEAYQQREMAIISATREVALEYVKHIQ